mgnify:CR=1 FL=1
MFIRVGVRNYQLIDVIVYFFMKDILEGFKRYILLERGFSENTRDAYLRDVNQFLDFLEDEKLNVREVEKLVKQFNENNQN